MLSVKGILASPYTFLRKVRSRFDDMLLTQRDAVAMCALASLGGPFVPITRYSMRPSSILILVNEIVINRRRSIVECGSGLSTIHMARALRLLNDGGKVTSIDNDDGWLNVVRAQLSAEGLDHLVTLVHAPLIPGDWGRGPSHWYDPALVTAAVASLKIDLLLVDGPVASDEARQYARYPAASILGRHCGSRAAIVIDDIDRKGERKLAEQWVRQLGGDARIRAPNGRIAVIHLGPSLDV